MEVQRVGRVDEEREGGDDGDLVDDQLLPGLNNYCFFFFLFFLKKCLWLDGLCNC